MGNKARSHAKKAQREAEAKQARLALTTELLPTSPTSTSNQISPSAPTISKKKCSHLKTGVKVKKMDTGTSVVFATNAASLRCSAAPCPAIASKTAWLCLCCIRIVCDAHLVAHEHDSFLTFPAASPDAGWTADDLAAALRNHTVRFHCTSCATDLATEKNQLLLDALSAVRKRLDTLAMVRAQQSTSRNSLTLHQGNGAQDPPGGILVRNSSVDMFASSNSSARGSPAPSLVSASLVGAKTGALKPAEYLPLGVHGLQNLGNTCYANALFQVLAHARHFAVPSADECEDGDFDPTSRELFDFLRSMAETRGSPLLNPGPVIAAVGKRFREFRHFGRQNDSHELLRCLADIVDSEHVKRERTRLGLEPGEKPSETDVIIPSPMAQCFRSILMSCIDCKTCGKHQTIDEEFYDLSLVMSSSLQTSFSQFFSEDSVMYACENPECPSRSAVATPTPEAKSVHSSSTSASAASVASAAAVPSEIEPDFELVDGVDMDDDEDNGDLDDAASTKAIHPSDHDSVMALTEDSLISIGNLSLRSDTAYGGDDISLQGSDSESALEVAPPPDADDSVVKVPSTLHAKRYAIKRLAPTLCLQLKRTARTKKTNIDFPLELALHDRYIDPRGATATPSGDGASKSSSSSDSGIAREPVHYELYGVVEHQGSMSFGHYTAYVRVHQPPLRTEDRGSPAAVPKAADAARAEWFYLNDTKVTRVSESQVAAASPYILVYQRIQ
ncbi:hypothetical protein BC828DRAFT_392307 [Blastocladiella britannica]|nr:hypothetical protein BC828DRAFT_392307 [Blastocladiella britannica]